MPSAQFPTAALALLLLPTFPSIIVLIDAQQTVQVCRNVYLRCV